MKQVTLAFSLLALLSCGRLATPGPDTFAVVDGDALPWSQFETYLESTGGSDALAFSSQVTSRRKEVERLYARWDELERKKQS